jgi:hypothetical protein
MDTDPIRAFTTRVQPARSSSSLSSQSAADRRAHRLQNQLCLCCGSEHHWIADCPIASQSPRSRSRTPSPPRKKLTARRSVPPVLE